MDWSVRKLLRYCCNAYSKLVLVKHLRSCCFAIKTMYNLKEVTLFNLTRFHVNLFLIAVPIPTFSINHTKFVKRELFIYPLIAGLTSIFCCQFRLMAYAAQIVRYAVE